MHYMEEWFKACKHDGMDNRFCTRSSIKHQNRSYARREAHFSSMLELTEIFCKYVRPKYNDCFHFYQSVKLHVSIISRYNIQTDFFKSPCRLTYHILHRDLFFAWIKRAIMLEGDSGSLKRIPKNCLPPNPGLLQQLPWTSLCGPHADQGSAAPKFTQKIKLAAEYMSC